MQDASLASAQIRPFAASSSVTLASSSNPVRYGSPVTLTATVSPSSATGLVTFYNGSVPIGSAHLTLGIGTLTTSLLTAGADYLTTHYGGDSTYLPANSALFLQTVTDNVGVGFPSYTTVNVGTNPPPIPSWVSVGDFNGDGKQDLVSLLVGTNQVAVSLGTGTGSFNAPFLFPTGINPYAIALGDFNGDGHTDLAVTSDDGVDILLGRGDGTFLTYVPYTTPAAGTGLNSCGLAVADFNGDGFPDLVVTNGLANNVSVFLGRGDGTFPTRADYNVGQYPQAVAVGDFNGDNHADFAVVDILDNNLYVFLGSSTGTFTPVAVNSNVGNFPNDIQTFDVNHDGRLDLVLANAGDNQVQVFTGNGNGTFVSQPKINVGNQPNGIVVADFNGDGYPDVAVLNSGDNSLTMLLDVFGNLTPQTPTYGVCSTCNYVQATAGDFNNDGVTDLVVADQGQDTPPGGLNVLLAQSCSYSVFPTSVYQDNTGIGQSVVLAGNGAACTWTATNSVNWLSLSTSSGSGSSATITLTIAPNNTGADRTGSLTVAGKTITVTQRSTKAVYTDVSPSAYYFNAVDLLSSKNITSGCGTTTFCPTAATTRAQMSILIIRSIYNGSDNFPYSPTPYFNDVPANGFGFKWIQRMYELGITAGCGSGNFCPNSSVTRDQMGIFIIRARFGASTNFTFPLTPYFADVPSGYFAFGWIQRMKEDAISAGCSPTAYCPTEVVARGDMAIFLMTGEFNQLLPAGTPLISFVSPTTLTHGQTGTFTITGVNTNFVSGQSTVVFGSNTGITINSISVNSPTSLQVSLTAAAGALPQPLSIYVQTGTQEAVLPNSLTIQ